MPRVHLTRVPGVTGSVGCVFRCEPGLRSSPCWRWLAPKELGDDNYRDPAPRGDGGGHRQCPDRRRPRRPELQLSVDSRPASKHPLLDKTYPVSRPRAGTDRSAVQVKHLDLGAQPQLPGPLLWVGLDTTVVTDVEDPSESLMLVVTGPSGVAVTGERRPRRLHLRRDFTGVGSWWRAEQLYRQALIEHSEHQGDIQEMAGAEDSPGPGRGPDQLAEMSASATGGLRRREVQAGDAEHPVGMREDVQLFGGGIRVRRSQPASGVVTRPAKLHHLARHGLRHRTDQAIKDKKQPRFVAVVPDHERNIPPGPGGQPGPWVGGQHLPVDNR